MLKKKNLFWMLLVCIPSSRDQHRWSSIRAMNFYLLVWFCLFLGQTNITFGKNIETTDKPSLDCDKFINLQIKLLGIQDYIVSIYALPCNAETLDSLAYKMTTIEEEFQHIIKHVKDEELEEDSDEELEECSKYAQIMLLKHLNEVEVEIKNLHSSLEECRNKGLPLEIIKARQLEKDERNMKELNNYLDILKKWQNRNRYKLSIDCDNRILLKIQTKLFAMQDRIMFFTAALGIAENSTCIITDIIAETSNKFQIERKSMENELLQIHDFGDCGKDAQTMLTNHLNEVEVEFENLHSSFETCRKEQLPLEETNKARQLKKVLREVKGMNSHFHSLKIWQNRQRDKLPLDCHELILVNIQFKLFELQNDIISITAAMGISETLGSVTDKIAETLKEFEIVKKLAESELLQIQERSNCSKDAQTMLRNHLNAVEGEIKNIQLNPKADRKTSLAAETIEDIKTHRFENIEQKFKQFKNFTDVLKIFQESYESLRDDDVFTKFLDSLTDINLINSSARALAEVMAIYYDLDSANVMSLITKLETEAINQPNVDDLMKSSLQNIAKELRDTLRAYFMRRFNDVVDKNFNPQKILNSLMVDIYSFDPFIAESIMKEFVNTNYDLNSSKVIFKIIEMQQILKLRVQGISLLFWKILKGSYFNSNVIIEIASALNEVRLNLEYEKLNKTEKDEVGKIIDNLPTCARNLFFLPSVCLWNKEQQQYLTAGNSTSEYGKSYRNIIFSEKPLPESQWHVNKTGSNFLFSSQSYDTEISGDKTVKESEWKIELIGDYCYVKSAAYNEKLISAIDTIPDRKSMSYAFTRMPYHSVKESKRLWQIRQCEKVN
ncbi:uncharacterized protein LOC129920224 isoform X2 [Episyrphus balteatus]|uniref:uncharacterized protein LOC129920224 isoform X2 n=1 Tax=Episyrphus balteatus TaxID=286459 RepID=UPI002485C256|nr:uncharacterized protein LOC129920224 isoform X2 [Episyrphus balteatus]